MSTAREQIEAALRTKLWITVRSTSTSIFATKGSAAFFGMFNSRGQLTFASYSGARVAGANPVGQLLTKINAT